jgi:AcrR family transcriptional regulator
MSKSGLFAHFGSKEELQLATVEIDDALFSAQVIEPASNAPTAIERLRRLVDGYLRYVEAETFPGGASSPRRWRKSTCNRARSANASSDS